MVKLLRNEMSNVPLLDQGWFGLRAISDQERDENEAALFEQHEWVGVRKTGIKALMDHIVKERRARIQENTPKIIGEIRVNLRNCEAQLDKLGEERENPAAQRLYTLKFCNELRRMADSALRGRYQDMGLKDHNTMLRYRVNQRLEKFPAELWNTDKIAQGLPVLPYHKGY